MNVLEMAGVKKIFAGIAALDGADLDVREGEIHGLTGENGSGKSTLAHVLAGIIELDSGDIVFRGARRGINSVASSQASGIGVAYQDLPAMRGVTAAQTIMMGREPHGRFGIISDRRLNEEAGALLEAMGIGDISPLDYAERLPERLGKFIGIARAVFLGTGLVVLDEPSEGLDSNGMRKLRRITEMLKNRGTPVILISRDPGAITGLCDRVTVLRGGRRAGTLESKDAGPDELLRLMGTHRAEYPARSVPPGGKTVRTLSKTGIEIRQGEILGINCANGAMKTEIIRSIFGVDPRGGGETTIFGIKMRTGPPGNAVKLRIGLSPDARKLRCAALCVTARKASAYARVEHNPINDDRRSLLPAQLFGGRSSSEETTAMIQNLFTPSGTLDGRSCADLIFGGADAVIFDEPSRGADEAAKTEIYKLMAELSSRGKGIALFSLDERELKGMCGRIMGFDGE
ncbi:MAG: ATP-binding cassette domain-containing protein [Synergistaceae bacterium]|jgi:ribose transport system ATP-binding protein|nr:ATP-binding cassette domain-containing protein [Synergistaceae bacterium]